MASNVSQITFEEARADAEKQAYADIDSFRKDKSIPLLDDEYLEAEHCWMFFQNKDIYLAPEYQFSHRAYAYSKKKGVGRTVYDLRDDPERMSEHLQYMSDFFAKRGE
ncbi:MAG: hypothetical protein E6Q98_26115 [Rhodospirillaceae bacterium]|jgi:hypothetical protein|nr:MAG: hypothetical protein E6Q98_26115 [Rhodospirillaceae bacterium]